MAANRIWIDLEMTGTDETAPGARVLEVAVVATTADAEYRELAHQSWVVLHTEEPPMAPEVQAMHTANGLLHEIPFGIPLSHVHVELVKFVRFFGNPAPGREPIAGSSVHFDQRWLQRHLPAVAALFSHRVFCARTLARFARDLGVDLPRAEPAHRALADIRASIQTARNVASALRTVRF
jgi:oligoribonuclease